MLCRPEFYDLSPMVRVVGHGNGYYGPVFELSEESPEILSNLGYFLEVSLSQCVALYRRWSVNNQRGRREIPSL